MPPPIPYSIAPWLSVADGHQALAFYKSAFGAEETYMLDTPDGVVARLSIQGAVFWISGGSGSGSSGDGSIRFILTVPDPDAVFARAIQAGAKEVFPVGEAHGWRLGRLADPFGFHWEIGRELKVG